MTKLRILLNKRKIHYLNRLKQRHGSTLYFLLAKCVGTKPSYETSKTPCLVWQWKQRIFYTQDWLLQTYINKDIPRELNRKQRRRQARLQLQENYLLNV